MTPPFSAGDEGLTPRRRAAENPFMVQLSNFGVAPRNPGWYPDPTRPTVVRWWNGTLWTWHTRPNDAKASRRGAPPSLLRIVTTVVCIVLGALGLVSVAIVVCFAISLNMWSSNK